MSIVYFVIEEPFEDRVKIGYSTRGKERLKGLQTGNANTLVMYDYITCETEAGARALEARLHKHYSKKHIRGEWFRISLDEIYSMVLLLQDVLDIGQEDRDTWSNKSSSSTEDIPEPESDSDLENEVTDIINSVAQITISDIKPIVYEQPQCPNCDKTFKTSEEVVRHQSRRVKCKRAVIDITLQ